MKAKLSAYTLEDLLEEFKNWERHPENENTVRTGESLLSKIVQGLPCFDVHVIDNQVIQNHDILMFVYECLLTGTPYAFNPISRTINSSFGSIPLETIYDNRKLFMYCRTNPTHLDLLRNVHDNLHKIQIPCYFLDRVSKESLRFYLSERSSLG